MIEVKVTESDIKKGIRFSSSHCPLSIAIARSTGLDYVYVGPNDVVVHKERPSGYTAYTGHHFMLPQQAIDFRRDFDDLKHVNPFTFEIGGEHITKETL